MKQNINQVIAEYILLMQKKIEGKTDIGNRPGRQRAINCGIIYGGERNRIDAQVEILSNIAKVIKVKWNIQTGSVYCKPSDSQEKKGNNRGFGRSVKHQQAYDVRSKGKVNATVPEYDEFMIAVLPTG